MKVLICGPEPSLKGGVTIWMKLVLDYFDTNANQQLQVEHLQIKRSATLTHMLPIYKKLYYAIKDYSRGYWALRNELKRAKYDVVHIVSSAGLGILRDWLFVRLAKRYHSATVVHYHCGTIPQHLQSGGVLRYMLRKVIQISDKVAVLDEASLKSINNEGCYNAVKIGNPYNPVIDEIVKHKHKRDSSTLLFVGHVVPAKGIRELLQAICDIPNVILKCIGPENYQFKEELMAYVIGNNLSDRVMFFGLRPSIEIYTEMSRATMFVLPTYTEGFPFVIVEAMACGCPIISTPVGAIKEMLSIDGRTQGNLVLPRDVRGLRDAILHNMTYPEESLEAARHAQHKAKMEYSLESVMSQLVAIWFSVKTKEMS